MCPKPEIIIENNEYNVWSVPTIPVIQIVKNRLVIYHIARYNVFMLHKTTFVMGKRVNLYNFLEDNASINVNNMK